MPKRITFPDLKIEWVDNESVLYEFTLTKDQILDGWALMSRDGFYLDYGKGYPKVARTVNIDGETYRQVAMYRQREWWATSIPLKEWNKKNDPEWRFGNWAMMADLADAIQFLEFWKPGLENQVRYLENELNKLKERLTK